MADEDKEKKERKSSLLKSLAAVGLLGGTYGLSKIPIKGGDQLFEKVKEEAGKRGIEVRPTPSFWKRLRSGGLMDAFTPAALIREPHQDLTPAQAADVEAGLEYPYGLETVKWKDILGKAIAWAPKGDAVALAHEMGHEGQPPSDHLRGLLWKAAPTAAAAAGVLGASLTKDPRAAELAGMTGATLSGMAALPALKREMGANINAYRIMRDAGASRGQLAAAVGLRLLPRTVGDIALAGAPAALSYFISKAIANRLRSKQATESQKKEAALSPALVGGGIATLLGGAAAGLAIYDGIKADSFPLLTPGDVKGVGKGSVDPKKKTPGIVKEMKLRKPPIIVTAEDDLKQVFSAAKVSPEMQRALIERVKGIREYTRSPVAVRLGEIDVLILPPKVALAILKHELGHAKDYQEGRDPGEPEEGGLEDLAKRVWWPTFNKYRYGPEASAWEHAKMRDTPQAAKALGTYEKGFHNKRSSLIGTLGALLLFGGGASILGHFARQAPQNAA